MDQENTCKVCVYRSRAFKNLTDKEMALIAINREERHFEKGEIIVEEGSKIDEFLYLQKGLVKLYNKEPHRKEHIISIAKPLDFIGLLGLFSNQKQVHSIAAIEDCTICFVKLNVIKELIRTNGNFALDFFEKISAVSDSVIKTRINIHTKQLRGRIAYILLFFAHHIYNSKSYSLPISRKEIAELIDMSTENVIRVLSEFRKDDIIEIEGKHILIKNLQRLEKIYTNG